MILNWIDPALLLAIYAFMCSAFCLAVSQAPGVAGVACLFVLFFFESICYPVSEATFPDVQAHENFTACSASSHLGRRTLVDIPREDPVSSSWYAYIFVLNDVQLSHAFFRVSEVVHGTLPRRAASQTGRTHAALTSCR